MIKTIIERANKIRDSWLKSKGYYKHKQTFTEEEIAYMYSETVGDVFENVIPESQELKMFAELANINFYRDYLRLTAAKDIQRYFAAETPKQQDVIRGAIARTAYFRSKLAKAGEEKKVTKVEGVSYNKKSTKL